MSDVIICGHGSGTPSTKNMMSYLRSRYAQFAPNGKRKGLVAVRRLKALKDEERPRFTAKYSTILGRNTYSQKLRQYVYTPYGGRYYSDCSSSQCATFQEIGHNISLLNTAGIYTSEDFETVPVNIIDGMITNPEVLKVGDQLLFRGSDPERPLQIGHVEGVYKTPVETPVYPVSGTLTVTASSLNIRDLPSIYGIIIGTLSRGDIIQVTAKCGTWFETSKGWISRDYVKGWILEPQSDPLKNYWYVEDGRYPIDCIKEINGAAYAFDRDGWMIENGRISSSGAIIY